MVSNERLSADKKAMRRSCVSQPAEGRDEGRQAVRTSKLNTVIDIPHVNNSLPRVG